MSPFAGEGVNLAMMDAADLAESIVAENDMEAALAAYESKMFVRAEQAAAESAKNLEIAFAPDSPRECWSYSPGLASAMTSRSEDSRVQVKRGRSGTAVAGCVLDRLNSDQPFQSSSSH